MRGVSAAQKRAAPVPELPRFRAPVVFGTLLLLFAVLIVRSLYLQWIDNAFLQEQGSSRYSREIDVPAHRGRIVDRMGEPLAISTPVKSIWAFPGQVEAPPEKLALLKEFLGGCGLNYLDRFNRRANLGYWVRASETGRGVATRAVRLLIDWAARETDLDRLEIVVALDNNASLRVAEKAGAVREGVLRHRLWIHGVAHDAAVFSILLRAEP